MPTGLVMFGGQGSRAMVEIGHRLGLTPGNQLIFICGRNEKLAAQLGKINSREPRFVLSFTNDVPYYMSISDFFIGKPGPGSISEALVMNLPVVVERNSWTLPQERYNADWIQEKHVGVVLQSWRDVGEAVHKLLEPQNLELYRSNVASLKNRAVFEIPEMLKLILDQSKPQLTDSSCGGLEVGPSVS